MELAHRDTGMAANNPGLRYRVRRRLAGSATANLIVVRMYL